MGLNNLKVNFSQAIVLNKKFPFGSKFLFFDKTKGKIEVIIKNKIDKDIFTRGSLIEYYAEPFRDIFLVTDINILQVPKIKNIENDLLFLHHLLELSEYFLTYNQPNDKIYVLFSLLYEADFFKSKIDQKLIIAYFFILLSIYPIDITKFNKNFFNLILESLDNILKSDKEHEFYQREELEKQLNIWLYECIQTHPKAKMFKTLDFLKR